MTKFLETAVAAVRQLPAESQDEIAATMLHLAESRLPPEHIDPTHQAAVQEGLEQARRRDFASDAEVELAFARFKA